MNLTGTHNTISKSGNRKRNRGRYMAGAAALVLALSATFAFIPATGRSRTEGATAQASAVVQPATIERVPPVVYVVSTREQADELQAEGKYYMYLADDLPNHLEASAATREILAINEAVYFVDLRSQVSREVTSNIRAGVISSEQAAFGAPSDGRPQPRARMRDAMDAGVLSSEQATWGLPASEAQ